MKVLVIGLGSMGKRRIRNLRDLGVRDIVGFDHEVKTARAAQKEYGIALLKSTRSVRAGDFDLAVISTPPGRHLPFVRLCVSAKIPFFVELNLISKEASVIRTLAKRHRLRAYPSDTVLFDPDIAALQKALGKTRIDYFLFHLGQNIHDWHPWQKAGEHFIFKPATNGMREMLRVELPWILQLFGPVSSVSAQSARIHTKKYGVDDLMSVELTFKSGARGVLLFDLIAPEVIKRLDVVSADRAVTWHERANMIEIKQANGKRETKRLRKKQTLKRYKFHEDAHLAEMRHVLKALRGAEKPRLHFEDEAEVLELINAIERACKTS